MCHSRSVSMTASMLLARPETAGLDHPGERDNVGQVFHGQLPSRLESIICPQLVLSKPWDTRVAWSLWPRATRAASPTLTASSASNAGAARHLKVTS